MLKLFALLTVVVTFVAVPSASARPERSHAAQGGVGTAVAAEIAKAGIKAGIAHFAPDLVRYSDPVAYGLAQIQAQLEEIDRKITQLIDHQEALEEHLNCVVQRSQLTAVVSRAQEDLRTLTNAYSLGSTSARAEVLTRLYGHYDQMAADQRHIHNALVGADGLIRACARHIETGMKPFLTSLLAPDVRNFYAQYHGAATALLVLRANYMALHQPLFGPTAAEDLAKEIETWTTQEEGWIKPAFPDTMSYDKDSHDLWRVTTIPHADAALRGELRANSWHVTGFDTTPTCSAIEAFIRKSGTSGRAALTWLAERNIIGVRGDFVGCYDDADHLHDYNLVTSTYYYAGNVSRYPPGLAVRQNNGLEDISKYSYLG